MLAVALRRTAAALGASTLVMAGCSKPVRDARPTPRVEQAQPKSVTGGPKATAAPAPAPASEAELPVPELVARLHRTAFENGDAGMKHGEVICLVTLHDAPLERGQFFPLVLFVGGSVATWRQKPTGAEEPFFAKLTAEEQARASELIALIPKSSALARRAFPRSSLVMGVSTRVGDRVQTLHFDNAELPAALSQLVDLLKQRLEHTNRAP